MILLINFLFVFLSIPQPGILLNGIVRNDSCLFHEEAQMIWTYASLNSGETFSYTAKIKATPEQSDLFVYKVLIPLATEVENCPVPENTILVNDVPKKYIRTLSIEGSTLNKVDTVYLSAKDRGTFQRRSLVW